MHFKGFSFHGEPLAAIPPSLFELRRTGRRISATVIDAPLQGLGFPQ